MKQRAKERNQLITGKNMKNNKNQHRITEILKEKYDAITFILELEMQYNVANISNAQNDIHIKLA